MDPFDDLDFSEDCPKDCDCPSCMDNDECIECGSFDCDHEIGCGRDNSPFSLLIREGFD